MKKDNRKILPENTLGKAKMVNIMKRHAKGPNEIFFSVEFLDGTKTYGYMEKTQIMTEECLSPKNLIQERKEHMSINIIEWNDSMNVVFHDGLFISQVFYRMKKGDFIKWYQTVEPIIEKGERTC